ncbi:hypothetical protein C8R45DRAFT_1075443 [Mycena sanguinolenta]|nr:hypothetical protein C8R45DRAFT_1075443 [Mycena sanguinolenta]
MVFIASILFAASFVLPSVMGLKLNTPANTAEAGTLLVTWTPAKGDPTFALLLDGPISIDAATGVNPTAGNTSVALGQVPPGTYKLQAVTGDAIGTVLSTSQPFQITAEGAVAAPPATATAAPAKGNTGTGAKTGKTGKGGAKTGKAAKGGATKAGAAKGAKPKGAQGAKPKAAPAAPKAAAGKAGAKKGPRMVSGVKFGRRELYRD